MCEIFEFSDFAKKMWKKIRFKFEKSEKFYKGFPCNFFTWKSFVNFFIIFKLESDFFPHFFAKSENSKVVQIIHLELQLSQFSAKKKTFLDHHSFIIHSSFIARTGAVGLGRFRLVHSQ